MKKTFSILAPMLMITGLILALAGCDGILPDWYSIALDQRNVMLQVGESVPLSFTVVPEDINARHVSWASDDDTIANVTDGILTGKAIGNTRVVVTAADGLSTSECQVTVVPPVVHVSGITLSSTYIQYLVPGYYTKLSATVYPPDATNRNVIWSSDNPSIVDVAPDGTVQMKAFGKVYIKATTEDGGYKASCYVMVGLF